ncbi:DPH4 homolog [Camellia sinensis]|nr:DPH4 homolog [Camellia sinensis]
MLLGKKLMGKTHYDILGVREDANYEEIRTSYRSAILDSHPDKLQKTSETSFPTHESGNRFLEVQRAWEILSNSKLREAYDSELQASRHDFVAAEDVGLEDLMVENTGEFLELFYQCLCGDYFSIDSSELEEMGYQLLRDGSKISLHISDATLPSSIILSCGSCSLQVRLLINADIKLQTNDHL